MITEADTYAALKINEYIASFGEGVYPDEDLELIISKARTEKEGSRRYGITADELHYEIVESISGWLEHIGCPKRAKSVRVGARLHPLDQVILSLISYPLVRDESLAAATELVGESLLQSEDYYAA